MVNTLEEKRQEILERFMDSYPEIKMNAEGEASPQFLVAFLSSALTEMAESVVEEIENGNLTSLSLKARATVAMDMHNDYLTQRSPQTFMDWLREIVYLPTPKVADSRPLTPKGGI